MADTEKVCPLCSTRVYHLELEQAEKVIEILKAEFEE